MPSVTETAPGTNNYTIADSKAFIGNFNITINAFDIQDFIITYPDTVTGLALTLQRTGPVPPPASAVVDLLTVAPGTVVDGFKISVDIAPPSLGRIQLTCHLEEDGGVGLINQDWELRAKAAAALEWGLSTSGAGTVTRNFVASDPRAELTTPASGSTVPENTNVTLAAASAALGTVLGTLPAGLAPGYRWSHTGPIAITGLPQDTAVSSYNVALPGVYTTVPIAVTVKTAFGGTDANNTTGFLESTSAPVDLSIASRPQHIVLVLDRSGSMASQSRWDSAVTATRVLTHLFAGAREGVNASDRIGIIVFEDNLCVWHAAPPTGSETKMALTALDKAKTDILTLDLGLPGSCTPIGDGLMAGIDLLAGGGPVGDKQFTIILLTDGFENSGTVHVGPTDPSVGAGLPANTIKSYGEALNDPAHPLRAAVNAATPRIFIVGLGATVESTVLNKLATDSGGLFASAAQATELADEFANMLQFSQEVNHLPASNTAPAGVPPNVNRAYFSTATGAERLVFAVLRGGLPTGEATVTLERWDPVASAFAPQPITVLSSSSHHAASVADLTSVTTGAPAIWRVTSVDATNTALGPLPAANVLAYEDLRVKAAVQLSQPEFLTGDDMTLTVRIRHDGSPIPAATVRAELVAPGEGLGETLSTLGPEVEIEQRAKDAPPLAGAMIEELMRRRGWKHWPTQCPTGLFVDGTDLLYDLDGDGNYSNTFARVFKEGVYSWTLFADGSDTSGNPFSRQLAIATVAGIRVDARATRIRQELIPNHPSGLHAVRVTITPMDVRGERLGPNKDHVVFWALHDGVFEHIVNRQPAPVFTDGTYQRVVLRRSGQQPTLEVKANGTLIPRFRAHPFGAFSDRDDPTRW